MSNSINKNIWLVMDENDKLKLIYAPNEYEIPTKYQAKILAGPLSSEELQRRVTQKDLSNKEIEYNIEKYQYWIIVVDNRFKLIQGTRQSVNNICNKFMQKSSCEAKIYIGPFNEKEAQENFNVYRHQTVETLTPIYWGLCKR